MEEKDRQVAINPGARRRREKYKKIILVVALFLLIVLVAYGVYYWQQQNIEKLNKSHQDEVATLNKTIEALKDEVGEKGSQQKDAGDERVSYEVIKGVISGAVEGGTYAELSTRMTNPVSVILAASEGLGPRTPEQAIEDLKYINNATGTWSFDVPTATLTEWRSGDYGSYIPENGVIGVSTDGYVVTFGLNLENKISSIFMSPDDDLL